MTNALMVTQTQSFSDVDLNFSRTYTFNEFDDLGGTLTLQKVTIIAELEINNGYFFATNTSEQTALYTIDYAINSGVTSGDVFISPAVDVSITGSDSATLAPTETLTIQVGGMNAYSEQEMTAFAASSFLGSGTFDLVFDANRTFDLSGVGGGEGGFSAMDGDGELTVIYEYVPEPVTLALLGLGGLFIRRRKA